MTGIDMPDPSPTPEAPATLSLQSLVPEKLRFAGGGTGANVVLCDGSVRFMRPQTSASTWR